MPTREVAAACVINVSEGRDRSLIAAVAGAGGDRLLDLHTDADHHRSVLTLGGMLEDVESAARSVAGAAVGLLDLRTHVGVHPRRGVVDVVPFVPLTAGTGGEAWSAAMTARNRFATWAGATLGLPCFLYGPERSLPDIRRHAFTSLDPDTGPPSPHPTAGACAVGVRGPLVAYNVWISGPERADGGGVVAVAQAIAASLRSPAVRSLGLPLGSCAQVSCNLTDPTATPIAEIYDAVARRARSEGCDVVRAELVGLLPDAVLRAVPPSRRQELDVGEDRTIEYRMAARGATTGTD